MKQKKSTTTKLTPSQLVKKQLTGNGFFDEAYQKPRIVEFLNLADYSINTESYVDIDEPLFEAIPPVISFTDYEPLQIKEKVFKLRNKDRFSRRVKIIQPDSKLFQILLPNDTKNNKIEAGTKVAAGMETKFIVRFSPEAKIDYKYELIVVTEREKFIVPILAIGKRAMIDFPDILDFGPCPVKFLTQKPVIIRNLGEKTTKWNLQLPQGFSSNFKEGVLQAGKNQQILIKFYPIEAKLYRAMAKLEYDKLSAYAELLGQGQLSNVYLSKSVISMEESYIGLQSQQTLHIVNKSNVKVSFEWRAFSSEKDEKPKKELICQQLAEEEAQQLMLLRQLFNSNQKNMIQENQLNDSSSEEENDPRELAERKKKRAELALARKYKTIRKAIQDDLFLFQDNIFKIEPLVGEIWPNSEITITVTFSPTQANTYECIAYCNISCAEERLPLKLKGEGLGPKAYLTQQEINFGDIFVNQPIKQPIQIENRGQIRCHFNLEKPERAFAKMFQFSVEEKTLEVGQSCSFEVKFKSSIPGEFKEKFRWHLQGSQRNLQMTFLGHVIAPTFEFADPNDTLKSKPEINFGKVSYDFEYKEGIILKNTSSVEFAYNLKILSQNKLLQNEFRIHPQSGIIPQKSERLIEIEFTPKSIKKYETVMTIDIEGVGNDMLSVPIKADCQVPHVDISPSEKVEFTEACLNYPETRTIILKNHSDIKAKFAIVPQSEESKVLAKYTVSPEQGVIDEKEQKQLEITLTTCKLGEITLPLNINIIGTNNNQPNLLNICANSDGPKVVVTPEQLDFGQVQVLKDYFLKVAIVNNSKIKAEFHAFTRQKISIFKPKVKHAFLQPGQRLQFDVICNADDASKFNDILHFVVKDGKDKDVILKAKGVGSTIYCQENLETLNFGNIYTFKTAVKEIFIQNRGRKSQKLTWQRKKALEKKKKDEEKPEEEIVFTIDPETETIPPKYGRYFRFVAMSQKKGKIYQQFLLMSQVGNERKASQLYSMNIEADFTQPNLVYSEKKLFFKYFWQRNIPILPIEKQLVLTSGSSLPLNFNLKLSPPFAVNQENHSLEPAATTKVNISFDPNFKIDKTSGTINGKINVVYADHPYRETVELIGQLCFPNLKLEASIINFGAILNDTTKKITMLMKNVSLMDVTYEWAFLEEEVVGEEQKMNISSNSMFPGSVPINEVFDILPLSGVLQPGQVQEVEFIYNAQGGILYRATAICHVEGGPNYEVKLEGDSSLISGKISEKQLDFGQQRFCQWTSKDIFIENTGKVTFEFKVDVESVKRKSFLEIIPMQGKISGGQKHKITIRTCPTMPEYFQESFNIQMGYYDPETITIRGKGVYPALLCQFPRLDGTDFENRIQDEVEKYSRQYDAHVKKVGKDKSKKKEMKTVEQFKQDLEKEMDRIEYCELINKEIEVYNKPEKGNANNIETKLFENVYLTSWICDFGNVIVGSTQKKVLKYRNVGQFPIEMTFDVRQLKTTDFKITPDKVKLAPGEEANVTVTLATKKNTPCKKIKNSIVLEVKNGAKYKLQILSNLTVPQIVIDGNPDAIVDFQKVLCGQRKTITLRFLNLKEVNCDWSLNLRQPVGKTDKDNEVKFELQPSSGRIAPGSFQIVKATFTPSQEKDYMIKFPIKIQENPKVISMQLKGVGVAISLEMTPAKIKLGPVLPYNNKCFAALDISNPSKFATELVSLDFDKTFRNDQEMLATYEEIINGDKKQGERMVYLPLRETGGKIWPEVIKEVEKSNKMKELRKSLEGADEESKTKIQAEINKLLEVPEAIEYPRKVDSENILHLVVYGPPKSGKTNIAQQISKLHKRALIKFDEIIDWVLDSGSETAEKIKAFLAERKKQLELALQEREKAFKKAGKKAKQLEQKIGPANETFYEHLPQDLWLQAIQQRIKHPECNAGCIFDNLTSRHLSGEIIAMSLLLKAIGNEAVSIIDLYNHPKPQGNQEEALIKPKERKLSKRDDPEEEEIIFEIVAPEESILHKFEQKRTTALKLFKNELEVTPAPQLFRDPIFFQINKDEVKKEYTSQVPTHLGNREVISFPIVNSNLTQKKSIKELIPVPFYRDPMKQPLPQPTFEQVICKPVTKPFESKLIKEFQIYTPKDNKFSPFKKPQKKEDKKKGSTIRRGQQKVQEPEVIIPVGDLNEDDLIKNDTRWVIPAETTLRLYVRFFSKTSGTFESNMAFDNTFNLKKSLVPVVGKTEFPSISNQPKQLFNNVKKVRPSTVPQCYLSKAFVLSQNVFDFGPLLIGKNAQKKNEKEILSTNSSVIKLFNNGSYPADLQFSFLSSIMQGDPAFKKNIFSISMERANVETGEVPKEVRVWAIPDEAKQFKDELIVMIKNNPTPLIVPLRCLGSKPSIEIIQGSPLKFTRILLNQNIKRELKIQNTSAIPVDFRLEGCQKLPSEFSVNTKQGRLKPNEIITVEVTFKALKQQKFNQTLKLVAEDIEGLKKISEPKDIPIEAEAFDISVELKFPNDNTENMLNFQAVRVGDFVDRSFTVKNIGLYNIRLSFVLKKKLYKDSFKIEPSQLELEPNNSKQILVRFSSLKEVKLKTNNNTTDINMQVLQGKTLQITKVVPINVTVNSVFSNYSVTPLKNMNFGPVQFNQTKTRTFEIKNEGLFEFNYCIFDYKNQQFRKQLLANVEKERQAKLEAANNIAAPVSDPKKAGKKEVKEVKKDAKKGKGGKEEAGLKIEQWSITPNTGTVAPNSSAIIEVSFAGKGQQLFEQKIAIDIQNRNPTDEPNGIEYELIAESCIPGINTDNFESIFQQQLVLQSQAQSNQIESMVKSNMFFVDERIFGFGTLVPSKNPEGVVEKIKIINSNKVPCTVKLEAKKKSPNAIQQFAFDVQPKEVKIAPHEHQYVKLIFNPTIMATYAGVFSAIVDNGQQQPKTHKLVFDLKGEGALPTLKVQKPKQYFDQRTLLLKFPKTRIGKANVQAISLKNQGTIPATAKFELTHNDHFKFIDSNSMTLTQKSYGIFNIEFKPREIGLKVWEISCNTLLNQFESYRFKIEGEAYTEDILFENLPLEEEDKINFGDCVIKEEKRLNFSIKNNTNEVIKFQWANHEDFSFIPKVGLINSKSSKGITVVFSSNKTITHKDLPIQCETVQIKQAAGQFIDWDDSMTIRRFITKTEFDWIERKKEQERKKREQEAQNAKKGGKKDNKKAPKVQKAEEEKPKPVPGQEADIQIDEVTPEPASTPIQKTEKALTLKATVVSDYCKYEVNQRIVDFYPTMMYTSRMHKVSVKNTSNIKMNYSCKIVSAQTGKIDPGFFTVSPHNGTVNPNCQQTFTIRFSPTEVEETNDRLLVISIKNLSPDQEKLIIQLNGQTQRPICHFELAPSNYRDKKPDIEAKYNIVQFQSLGTKVKNTKRFYVINPTSLAYDFEWKRINEDKGSNPGFFRCVSQKGTILSGKKSEMVFEYTPDLIGVHQSYWIFQIPSEKITQYFLMVGSVKQPNVFFDMGKINFGPLLIGGKNKEVVSIKNMEDVPLTFNFDKESIRGEIEYSNSLTVQPMSGVVPSQGEVKVEVSFEPKTSQAFNYNINCNVMRRNRPIFINVKGIGYVLSHSVFLSGRPNAIQRNQKCEINFGSIFVNEVKDRKLVIQNSGDFNFDFAIKTSHSFPFLKISNEFGTVKKNEKFTIDLLFAPQDEFAFKSNASICLSIISGPTYTFILRGAAKTPGIDFSFYSYDFGPCFVLKQPLPITAELEIRNREATPISIESKYLKSDYLDVKIPSGQVVLPIQVVSVKNKKGTMERIEKNMLKVPIVFTPRDLTKYNEDIVFDINGLNKMIVKIKGEGIPLKLELEKTEDQNIDFGVTKVGNEASRTVSLFNYSKKKIEITFDVDGQLQELKKHFIQIVPNSAVTINPRQKHDIQFSFKPSARINAFKTGILYKIVQNQEKRQLLNIFGTAHGIQMKLMEDTVGFGTVVVNSKISKTIQLSNFGDIGSKFEWDTMFCGKFFTIQPQKGYLLPHEDLLFNVTFHPNVPDNDIKFKVKCSIEGAEPLYVNLIGKCIPQPQDTIQQLKFDCMVRKEVSQKVIIKNTTPKPWKIKASISNEGKFDYFKGKEFIEVNANSQADYEIVYMPLTMTKNQEIPEVKDEKHVASLFFPIPDGSALMYRLVGTASPAALAETFDVACKAKFNKVHNIPIKNWLKVPQRFNVQWKFDVEDKALFINGATIFDVPGDSQKDYKLSIYALKAVQAKFSIYFRNPLTNEFIFYKVNLNVSPSDPQKDIVLTSLVREATKKTITIENPLPHPVEIKKEMIVVESQTVFVTPQSFTIPPKSQFGLELIYRPLLAKEESSKLSIKSPDLGEFVYPLKLTGTPSNSERSMNFKTSLGSQITQKFKFIHYGKKPTTYTCRVEKLGQKVPVNVDPKAKAPPANLDFSVQTPTLQVPASETFEGIQASINVKFQPSGLNQSACQLIISSPDAGQYIGILNGYTVLPQPKGPFKIAGAKPAPIEFKNPFFEAYEFTVRVDNPAFTSAVKSPVKVDGKKVLSISLGYKQAPGYSSNGRLSISAGENLTWVFYLQGQ